MEAFNTNYTSQIIVSTPSTNINAYSMYANNVNLTSKIPNGFTLLSICGFAMFGSAAVYPYSMALDYANKLLVFGLYNTSGAVQNGVYTNVHIMCIKLYS